MQKLNRQNNFTYLFVSLILFLFTASVVAEFSNFFSRSAFTIIIVLMLVASIKSLHADLAWKRIIYVLLPIFLSLSLLNHFFENKIYIFLVLSTLLFFFIGNFSFAIRQVLFEGDIDSNKIIGSLTLYILLGMIWAVLYLMILVVDPQAFSGLEVNNWKEGFSRIAYYSFVTLTTLGYGDVLPQDHVAEFFVYMEAIIGVFYMAIIVSSLISLRLNTLQKEREGK